MKINEKCQYITVGHISETLGVCYATAMKIAMALPHIKLPGRGLIRVSKKAFEEYIAPKAGD